MKWQDREQDAAFEEARKMNDAAQTTWADALRRAHSSGATISEIAQRLGCSRMTVKRGLERLGLQPNPTIQVPKGKSFRAVLRESRQRRG